MGLKHIFDDRRADLKAMGTTKDRGNLSILSARQNVAAEMDEEGFKAAAVMSMLAGATSAPRPATIHMIVDRPYLFVLRDQTHKLVLFMGAVEDPSK